MRPLIAAVRSRARHRGKTAGQLRAVCEELAHTLVKMTAEYDDLTCTVVRLTAENDRLRAKNAELEADFDRAAIDYSGALEDLRAAHQRLAAYEPGAA